MDNVTLIKKIQEALILTANINYLYGEDSGRENGLSGSQLKKNLQNEEILKKLEEEIIDSLCQHKWKRYTKFIYDCEICKTRRFSKEDLCPTTQQNLSK